MGQDVWAVGDAYEAYVGRWSRRVAEAFVSWVSVPSGQSWLDVGCGTGALTSTVLSKADPRAVTGVDPSAGFLETAQSRITDSRVTFAAGDAQALPLPDNGFDVVVSGLALNFVPSPALAAAEFSRVVRPGGVVAAYVWDYAEGMQMMRYFWDAAAYLDPADASLDESGRFPLCQPDPLRALWTRAGLGDVMVKAIEIPMAFQSFEDFWQPFLGGQGPAPAYAMSLGSGERDALRELLRERLPSNPDGSIALTARAWAVRGLGR
jgi:SAM-dependent methyltransferase